MFDPSKYEYIGLSNAEIDVLRRLKSGELRLNNIINNISKQLNSRPNAPYLMTTRNELLNIQKSNVQKSKLTKFRELLPKLKTNGLLGNDRMPTKRTPKVIKGLGSRKEALLAALVRLGYTYETNAGIKELATKLYDGENLEVGLNELRRYLRNTGKLTRPAANTSVTQRGSANNLQRSNPNTNSKGSGLAARFAARRRGQA